MLLTEKFTVFQDYINAIIAAVVAGVISLITLFFKNLPSLIKQRTRRTNLIYDWSKASKINAMIQDVVQETGATYSHIIKYHNGGPRKMSVIYEAMGSPCATCISPCSNRQNIKRLQDDWQDRLILPFWLNNMALKTLNNIGSVNTVEYSEVDETHKMIWKEINAGLFKEILVKAHSDSFITFSLTFCTRFKDIDGVDSKLMTIANRLSHLV
jgi:hypothetical protein